MKIPTQSFSLSCLVSKSIQFIFSKICWSCYIDLLHWFIKLLQFPVRQFTSCSKSCLFFPNIAYDETEVCKRLSIELEQSFKLKNSISPIVSLAMFIPKACTFENWVKFWGQIVVETKLQEIHECQSETNIGTQLNSPITTANIRREFIPFVFRAKNSVP